MVEDTARQMTEDTARSNGESFGYPRGDLQVVARVAALLRLITPTTPDIGLAEASASLGPGVSKSTAHRYLSSLEYHGILKRVDGTRFTLGPLVDQLGALAMTRWRLAEVAAPVMHDLASSARQTIVLSLWGGMGPVITRVTEDASQVVHISVRAGSTLPFESAQGLVFLAYLSDTRVQETLARSIPASRLEALRAELETVRRDGIASHEQMVAGVRAIAVPVFDRDGHITAALAIVGTLNSVPADIDSGPAQALRAAGEQLTRFLQGEPSES